MNTHVGCALKQYGHLSHQHNQQSRNASEQFRTQDCDPVKSQKVEPHWKRPFLRQKIYNTNCQYIFRWLYNCTTTSYRSWLGRGKWKIDRQHSRGPKLMTALNRQTRKWQKTQWLINTAEGDREDREHKNTEEPGKGSRDNESSCG